MHPLAVPTDHRRNGALGMRTGQRIIYAPDGRCGVADEFLQDGEVYLTLDDGSHVATKWRFVSPEPDGLEIC